MMALFSPTWMSTFKVVSFGRGIHPWRKLIFWNDDAFLEWKVTHFLHLPISSRNDCQFINHVALISIQTDVQISSLGDNPLVCVDFEHICDDCFRAIDCNRAQQGREFPKIELIVKE